jgi:hypothetical protein
LSLLSHFYLLAEVFIEKVKKKVKKGYQTARLAEFQVVQLSSVTVYFIELPSL